MPAIFLSGFQDHGEDVVVFTEKVTARQLSDYLRDNHHPFDDCVELRDDEQQYYCGDRCWLYAANERVVLEYNLTRNKNEQTC